jgi:hypothetical protein
MKKILIISSTFPPNSSVGGLRPFYFFKYFNESELDTFVFTVNHDSYNNLMDLDIDNSLMHKVNFLNYTKNRERDYIEKRTILKKIRDFFNPSYSSPPGLLDAAIENIQKVYDINSFDLILTTVPDMWTATLGSRLSKKYNKKLIIDFRDAHEQELGMPRTYRQKVQNFRLLNARRNIVKNAFQLITVSEFLAQQLEKKINKKTSVIYNGFDNQIFISDDKLKQNDKLQKDSTVKIVYTGRILNLWYQNPLPLINVINSLSNAKNPKVKIELHFYGVEQKIINSLINNKDFNNIFFHDRVNYNKVNDILNEADLLLVLTNNGRRGILTTKLYEYMPIQKPVICLPNEDKELAEIICKYGLGFSLKDQEEIEDFFKNYDQNMISFDADKVLRKKTIFFTRENQSKILAEHIKQILN